MGDPRNVNGVYTSPDQGCLPGEKEREREKKGASRREFSSKQCRCNASLFKLLVFENDFVERRVQHLVFIKICELSSSPFRGTASIPIQRQCKYHLAKNVSPV